MVLPPLPSSEGSGAQVHLESPARGAAYCRSLTGPTDHLPKGPKGLAGDSSRGSLHLKLLTFLCFLLFLGNRPVRFTTPVLPF